MTEATTLGERQAAADMIEQLPVRRPRIRVAADKAYDDAGFVQRLRQMQATPHVTQYTRRPSAIDGRTSRHASYRQSQSQRRHIERIFGWLKQVAGQRKTRFRGRRVQAVFAFALLAYNLVRMINLERSHQTA